MEMRKQLRLLPVAGAAATCHSRNCVLGDEQMSGLRGACEFAKANFGCTWCNRFFQCRKRSFDKIGGPTIVVKKCRPKAYLSKLCRVGR